MDMAMMMIMMMMLLVMLMMMRRELVRPFFHRHRDGHSNCDLGSVEDKPFYCMPNVTKTVSRTSLSTECRSAGLST